MLDRSQRFGIAVSCGLHALVGGAFTLVSALAPSSADSSRRPEAVIVEIRLDGPETRFVDVAPRRSSATDAQAGGSATPLPAVSAAPPRKLGAEPVAPKSTPEPAPAAEAARAPVRPPAPPVAPRDGRPEARPEAEALEAPPTPPRTPPSAPPERAPAETAPPAAGSGTAPDGVAGASGIGSEVAASGGPSGGSGAAGAQGLATGGGDEVDDPLARYLESVRTRIQARKHYPPLARKRSVEGRVVARVAIRADGRIQAIDFERGAQPLLRRATHDAIRAAAPYPAPPAGAVTIELPIDYSLRDAS